MASNLLGKSSILNANDLSTNKSKKRIVNKKDDREAIDISKLSMDKSPSKTQSLLELLILLLGKNLGLKAKQVTYIYPIYFYIFM